MATKRKTIPTKLDAGVQLLLVRKELDDARIELMHARAAMKKAIGEADERQQEVMLLKQHNLQLLRYVTKLAQAHWIATGLLEHSRPAAIQPDRYSLAK
jgi:hypothetical protein